MYLCPHGKTQADRIEWAGQHGHRPPDPHAGAINEVEEELGNKEIPFGKVLYAITRNIKNSDLFDMDNETLLRHIQKIQLIEG